MIRTQTWHPDTCECQIQMDWDDSLDVSDGGTNVVAVRSVKNCPAHEGLSGEAHYQAVLEHNRAVNAQRNKG